MKCVNILQILLIIVPIYWIFIGSYNHLNETNDEVIYKPQIIKKKLQNNTIQKNTLNNNSHTINITKATKKTSLNTIHKDENDLILFTYTNLYYTFICDLLRTAIYHNYHIKLLGWDPHGKANDFRLGMKISTMLNAVKDIATQTPNKIVVFCDGHDTLIQRSAGHVINTFQRLNASILFSGEKGCCCDMNERECQRKYPKPDRSTSYPYLNLGGWIAYAADAYKFLYTMETLFPDYSKGNDQTFATKMFFNSTVRYKLNLKIDYDGHIFQTMHLSSPGDVVFHANKGMFYNTLTYKYPTFIHYNGGSKSQQRIMDKDLRRIEDKNNAIDKILNHNIDGVNLTIYNFCCSSKWTGNAFNKLRPSWANC